jgi:hypothetical protein
LRPFSGIGLLRGDVGIGFYYAGDTADNHIVKQALNAYYQDIPYNGRHLDRVSLAIRGYIIKSVGAERVTRVTNQKIID